METITLEPPSKLFEPLEYLKEKPTSYTPLCIIRYCYQAGAGDKYVFTIDDCYQNAPTLFGLLKLVWVVGCTYSDGKVTHPGPPKVGDIINDEEGIVLEIIELKEPKKNNHGIRKNTSAMQLLHHRQAINGLQKH